MDIFSHGLWTAAVAKGANDYALKPKSKKPLKIGLASFWGIFPDLFAFTVPFVWMIARYVSENRTSDFPAVTSMEPSIFTRFDGLSQLTHFLYSMSHSLVMFFSVFAIVSLLFRRPVFEMFGWLLHILIDIPSHSYQFYPTPFLWPVSDFKVNGVSWASTWFMIVNYSLLVLVWLFFWIKKKKSVKIK